MRRIEQLARDDRAVSKLQSDLVVERRELALRSDEIAAMRRQAEAAEAVARGAMDTARTAALKLTNRQLSELRSMRKPPESVLVIMEALRLLFEDLPSSTKKQPARAQDWSHHKLILFLVFDRNYLVVRCRTNALGLTLGLHIDSSIVSRNGHGCGTQRSEHRGRTTTFRDKFAQVNSKIA